MSALHCSYSILPNRRVYTFISGKVYLLASIKIKRRTLPKINVHTCLFGCIEYIRKFHTKWHEYVTNVNRWLVGSWSIMGKDLSTYFVNAPLNRLLPPHGGRPCSCVHFFPSPSELFCLKNEFPLLPSLDPSLLLLLQVPLQRNPGHCLNPASITLKNV